MSRQEWHDAVYDKAGNLLTMVKGKSWFPEWDFSFTDALICLAIAGVAGGTGWFSHALFGQPDYSEVLADLKANGYNNLALTVEEQRHICPNGSNRQKRSCQLLLTAPDILAKVSEPVADDAPKVAQARVNVPGDKVRPSQIAIK